MKLTDEDRQFARMLTDFLCLPELEEWQVWVLMKLLDDRRAPAGPCTATYVDPFAGTLHCGKPRGHGPSKLSYHLVTEGHYAGTRWYDGMDPDWSVDPSLQGAQQKLDSAWPEPDGLNPFD